MLFVAGDRHYTSFFELAYGIFTEAERLRRFAETYRDSARAETVVPGLNARKRTLCTNAGHSFFLHEIRCYDVWQTSLRGRGCERSS